MKKQLKRIIVSFIVSAIAAKITSYLLKEDEPETKG